MLRFGASNPVSHMSLTMAIFMGSDGSFIRSLRSCLRCLFRMCSCQAAPSAAEPVITTFIVPLSSSW